MPRIHYVMAVWGEHHRRLLTEFVLPTQLSPGNLPGCRHRATSIYKFYTLPEDAAALDRHPMIARLRELIAVEILTIAPEHHAHITGENAYDAMSVFHRHAIRAAVADDAFLVFMTADAIVSDGSFSALERYAEEGADCVVLCGVRCALEEAEPTMRALLAEHPEAPRLTARQMTDLLLRHPHRLARAIQWGADPFNSRSPGHVYWFGETGLVAHGWHLHPWMIRAVPGSDDFLTTIDADYVENARVAGLDIRIVQDSDDVCVVELSNRNHHSHALDGQGPLDLGEMRGWSIRGCKPIHHEMVKTPILFKGTAYRPEELAALRDEAAAALVPLAAMLAETAGVVTQLTALESLRDEKRVFLYGAGEFGRKMRGWLREAGIDGVAGFLDSARGGVLDGEPITQFDDYRAQHRPDDLILICSQHLTEIANRLSVLSAPRVVACSDFFLAQTKNYLRDTRIIPWTPANKEPRQ